jgi:hypothetical protein
MKDEAVVYYSGLQWRLELHDLDGIKDDMIGRVGFDSQLFMGTYHAKT